MTRGRLTESADHSVLQFRERTVRDGARLSYVVIAVIGAYTAATWADRPHPTSIAVLLTAALVATVGVSLLPAARIVRSRWRELFFLGWSGLDLALLSAIVAADGGHPSTLRAVVFLPVVFSALAYPPVSAALVGAQTVVAYVIAATATGAATTVDVVTYSSFLVTASVMGVSQAVNHQRQRRELAWLSRSDPLTGCLNRRGFAERFSAELAGAQRHAERALGLILVDLDDFKRVNDTRGHAAGDDLLCCVAATLATGLRPGDVLARLGGDEFAVLLPEVSPSEIDAIAQRIEARLEPLAPASIGTASLPHDGVTAEALHRHADADLYRGKQRELVVG